MVVTKATIANRFLLEAKGFKSAVNKGMSSRIVRLGKKVKANKVQVGLDGEDFRYDRNSVFFYR